MHRFKFRGNQLYCEDAPLERIAGSFDTPLYVYSHGTLLERYRELHRAFRALRPLICFSMKSNSNLAVCRTLVREGAGLDVVSGGELFRARKTGVSAKKVVYASVGKTAREIESALRWGILFFNAESYPEIELINTVARRLQRRVRVGIRLNPDVTARTHRYITTAAKENKFGIPLAEAERILLEKERFSHLKIDGIQVHLGSQITESDPYVKALKLLLPWVERLQHRGVGLKYFNLGGGLGIIYQRERPQSAAAFARSVLPYLRRMNLKIILEPGRFIAGNAGVLLTRVLYVKENDSKTFVIIDAAMNDLIRPTLYGSYHQILPARKRGRRPRVLVDVVGPVCESGDFLAENRRLPQVKAGELLAIMSAGAYAFSMSSNYNSRPRPAEVLVKGNKAYLVRKRESYQDLIRGETIPREVR